LAGKPRESIQHLEHLILTYPQSALVPEARRRLDQERGKVPHS
jgi:outer membrane protein assembly factor BamD (BamD/ComL family)